MPYLPRTLISLTLGGVLTVLFAWALNLWSPTHSTWGPPEPIRWPASVPATWPERPQLVRSRLGFGVTVRAAGSHTSPTDEVAVQVLRSGWPFRSMHRGTYAWTAPGLAVSGLNQDASTGYILPLRFEEAAIEPWRAELPLHPLWPGFLANTTLFAMVIFAIPTATTHLRRRTRLRRGLCPTCAYPLAALHKCPECGTAAPKPRDTTKSM